MNIQNKNVLITGASTGIGKELALRFSKEKCNLILISRRTELIDEYRGEIEKNGSKLFLFKCDVSDKKNVEDCFNKIYSEVSNIDFAILNSAVSYALHIEKFDLQKAEEMINTNLLGVVYCLSQLTEKMINQKSGVIVGVSSLADARGFPKSGIYSATKSALTTYLESVRNELYQYGIDVLIVRPGFVRTPMTSKNNFKMPFLVEPEVSAEIIFNGIMKRKKIIQFPLPIVILSRLIKIFPDFIFDIIAKIHLKQRTNNVKQR